MNYEHSFVTWWCHVMETHSILLALCEGNPLVTGGFASQKANSPHKGPVIQALMFSLILAKINNWINQRITCDLSRHDAHCDVIVMMLLFGFCYIMSLWRIQMIYLPLSFRVASLALGQSLDCPSASEVTLKNMGTINWYQTTTKHELYT